MDHILTITMLGTGNALATRCYNTCFTLRCLDGSALMVDAGGGNGVLTQLERAGMRCEDIHDPYFYHMGTGAIFAETKLAPVTVMAYSTKQR